MAEHDQTPGTDNVISLEEFRQRFSEEAQNGGENAYKGFEAADYDTYHAVRHVLTKLKGKAPAPDDYALAVRDNAPGKDTFITNVVEGDRDLFAIGLNPDEWEAFTSELENQDTEIAEDISSPLHKFPVTLYIAKYILKRDNRISHTSLVTPPKIGDAELNLENRDRWLEVTRWRAAARLAIEGVSPRRPERRDRIISYLSDINRWRAYHDISVVRLGELIGRDAPPDPVGGSDMFIGACNPLTVFDLKRVLTPPRSLSSK